MNPTATPRRASFPFGAGLRALALLPLALGGVAGAQQQGGAPTLTIDRQDATIVIVNRSPFEAGARTRLNIPRCTEGVRTSIFYGPSGERVTVDIDDSSEITARLVVVEAPEGDGSDTPEDSEKAEQTTLEATPSDIELGRACIESRTPLPDERVQLVQGRTTVFGSRFFLDRDTDVATMEGPIDLTRAPEGDADELTADAEALAYDLETDRSTLTGGVRVTSGGRVSEAELLELDEAAGRAILRGNARSVKGDEVVEGDTLVYYLDSNAVEALGRVKGTLVVPGPAAEPAPVTEPPPDGPPPDGGEDGGGEDGGGEGGGGEGEGPAGGRPGS